MSALVSEIRVEDAEVLGAIRRMIDRVGTHSAATMGAIARYGESSTRLRFRTQTGPDGQRWRPSLRAQIAGGRTLTMDGHLGDSVGSNYGADWAEWGENRVYAAIHQFGGIIRAKAAKALRFFLAGGGFAVVRQVVMPARPSLGVSDDDANEILNIVQRRIEGSAHAQ